MEFTLQEFHVWEPIASHIPPSARPNSAACPLQCALEMFPHPNGGPCWLCAVNCDWMFVTCMYVYVCKSRERRACCVARCRCKINIVHNSPEILTLLRVCARYTSQRGGGLPHTHTQREVPNIKYYCRLQHVLRNKHQSIEIGNCAPRKQ